jgi:hypothetical protein
MFPIRRGCCVWSLIPKVARAYLVGRRFECDGGMGGKTGNEPAKLNLKDDETGEPFHIQQAKQIRAYRQAWGKRAYARAARLG